MYAHPSESGPKKKRNDNEGLGSMWRTGTHPLLVGMQPGMATAEINVKPSQKTQRQN